MTVLDLIWCNINITPNKIKIDFYYRNKIINYIAVMYFRSNGEISIGVYENNPSLYSKYKLIHYEGDKGKTV